MELVSFIGNDKENWGQTSALMKRGEWDNVIIVKSSKVSDFPLVRNAALIEVNTENPLVELKKEIISKIGGKLKDFEVSLSLASGNGKEHMALISALLSIPVGIRLVVFTQKGIEFIN